MAIPSNFDKNLDGNLESNSGYQPSDLNHQRIKIFSFAKNPY